ncbi:unnamed protein product [Phytophthora lilii]|uniref:ubiquitinyl hydrolase 1 n=1 Tax=Phytophthora lilii TaxID=2077276 RepID=A0A9W6X3J4_9STRA|nr:unnamed protein product [Phytophthora lilii]
MLKTAMQKREPVQELKIPPPTHAEQEGTGEPPNTVLGFTNLGNTCYFNASMQALLTATHYFPEHTHIEDVLETTNTPITTTFTYVRTVKKRARRALAGESPSDKRGKSSRSGRSRSGSSSVLTVAPLLKEMRKKFAQFRGHYQQDAHELFTSFLWAIDEEMDPPLPPSDETTDDTSKPDAKDSVTNSSCSTANSSELPDDDGDDSSSRNGTWPEDDTTDSEMTEDGEQEAEEEGCESDADNSEQEETKQIFVKTETGETISMQVPKSATVKEVQHLLAKRLNLNEEDMMLDASKVETRATLSSRPSAVLHARAEKRKMYSKLNFTRNLFGGALTTAVTCKACGKRTEIVEDAFHLSVSVPDGHHRELTTTDCLDNFVSETQLLVEANNGYDCEKCSRQPKVRSVAGRFMRKKRLGSNAEPEMEVVLRDASMQLFVSALPRVLVVHIKRLARSRKITQHIAFDEKLDMTPYVSEMLQQGGGDAKNHSLCYELIALVVHMGNKRSGHYVAYVSRSRRREALLAARARSRLASEEGGATVPEVTTPRNSEGPSRTWYYVSDTVVKRVSFEQLATAVLCRGWSAAESMSSEAQDESATEVSSSPTENADTAVLSEDQLHTEEDGAKRWHEELEKKRAEVGDAEETCVFLVEDLLAAIFQEMQVRSENAALFATSARQMCLQAFESVDMSAFTPSESLDRIPGPTQHERDGRQRVLKPQSKWASSPQSGAKPSGASRSMVSPASPLLFLRRLLTFLEICADRVDLELQRFSSSEAISLLSGKRKLINGSCGDYHGEWCISINHIPLFLQELLSKGLVSAVPSTITFVMAVNHDFLDKKLHSQARVALPHLQQLVQKALLAAEEEEENRSHCDGQLQSLNSPGSESKATTDMESTPRSRIFQTEVPVSKVTFHDVLKNSMKPPEQPDVGPEQELLSSYLEEIPPRAIEMDRRAPGQVGKKAALSAANPSQRAISRKVILLMAPPPRQGSRWKTVRHKLIVPSADEAESNGVTNITAEADMELHLAGDRHHPPVLSSVAERKATGLSVHATVAETLAETEEMLDTAALSNIFSLGTPRQLSAQELARRNDLLAQLEREAIRAQRRATTTVIASMSIGGVRRESDSAVRPSQADHQEFQAYVAANSIVTMGIESDGRSGALSPTRPQQSDQAAAPRNRGRGNLVRSKFELKRDTLPFDVSDGNAHVREEQDRLSAAMCSPIKRARASISPSPPPETPGRPIQTASTLAHLPQLDSSRLAVGVSAVTAFDGIDEQENAGVDAEVVQMPFSPVRTTGPPTFATPSKGVLKQEGKEESTRDYRLPLIPVVSPIKASPHRKHVAFKFQNESEKECSPATISPKAHVRQRPSAKVKQPVWEAKTRPPPRARNHHFASGRNFRKIQRYDEDDKESSSARRLKQEEQAANIFRQVGQRSLAFIPCGIQLIEEGVLIVCSPWQRPDETYYQRPQRLTIETMLQE